MDDEIVLFYKKRECTMTISCRLYILIIFSLLNFWTQDTYANLKFSNPSSVIAMYPTNSLLKITNVSKVTGWSEQSIVKAFGNNAPSQWVEGYTDNVIIAQTGGTAVPHTNLIYSDSNAINSLDPLVINNSNAVVYLNVAVRTDSNAFAYGIRNNSNAIIYLNQITGELSIHNSNAIIALNNTVRTDSNAFAYGIKNNSNTLLALNRTTSNALLFSNRNNSNAIVKLGVTERTNSNAFAYGITNNSNAITKLDITERTNSNAFAYGIKNNSNTLLALNRTTSNALLFSNRNNSNAIVKLGVTERTNSNAFAYGITNNSNAITKLDITERTNSNAFAYGIKNNSNTLLALNRTTSNALLFGDRNNSNAIINLGVTDRTNSNAFAYGIKNNSNAIIKLNQITGELSINNSNAIVSWIKSTSNSVVSLDSRETNLENTVRTDSNAFAYGIRNNSNAIVYLNQITGELSIHNSNAIIALNNTVRTDSNAFAYGIRNNSNAIVYLNQITGELSIHNSNAIVKINAEMITINGPGVTQISTPTYTMLYDIYLSTDHTLNIANSCVLDGNGHMINFAKDSPNIFTTGMNSNVILNNVVLKNFDDSSVQLGAGATLTFGDGCRIDLADEQTMSMPWIFSGNSAINGYGNPLDLGTQSIQIMQSGTLAIENLLLSGLVDNNVRCLGPNANITFKNDTLQITGDYSFTAGSLIFQDEVEIKSNNELSLSNEFIYASDQISTINSYSRLKLDYGVFFYYAPSVVSRNLIAMQDISSELYLNGCALATSSVGMCLIKGTLTVDSDNQLIDVLFGTPTSLAQSICFGDGFAADDLAINILPGGQLDITNGILDYQNVN